MSSTDASIAFPRSYLNVLNSGTSWEFQSAAQSFNAYDISVDDPLRGMPYYFYDESRLEAFWSENPNSHEALRRYIYGESIADDLLASVILQAKAIHPELTIVTWLNCESLKAFCYVRDIRIIFNEFGPLRKPLYQQTAYFDCSGVNGGTSAAADWHAERASFRDWVEQQGYSIPALVTILAPNLDFDCQRIAPDASDLGIALQVEDDSNAIAYANGWTAPAAIAYGQRLTADSLLRVHPQGLAAYAGKIDQSPTSLHFMLRCKEILTINSSVGIEAIFWGKSVRMLGDCSVGFLTQVELDDYRAAWVYYFFSYLIPYDYLFDYSYYVWRLGNPTAIEIAQKHLSFYTDKLRSEYSDDKERHLIAYEETGSNFLVISNPVQDFQFISEKVRLKEDAISCLETELGEKKREMEYHALRMQGMKFALTRMKRFHLELNACERRGEVQAARIADLELDLATVLRSKSWKMTKPLRRISGVLARFRQKGRIIQEGIIHEAQDGERQLSSAEDAAADEIFDVEQASHHASAHLLKVSIHDVEGTSALLADTPEDLHLALGGAALYRMLGEVIWMEQIAPFLKTAGQCTVKKHGVDITFDMQYPHERAYAAQHLLNVRHPQSDIDTQLLARLIEPGDCVLDAGANIGVTALECLRFGARKVVAIEAEPTLYERLCSLKSEALIPLGAAISSAKGYADLLVSQTHNQGATISAAQSERFSAIFGEHRTYVRVPTLSIDDIAHLHGGFQLWKLDIEGAEVDALRGAQQTLRDQCPRHIIAELFPHVVDAFIETAQITHPYGYRAYLRKTDYALLLMELHHPPSEQYCHTSPTYVFSQTPINLSELANQD